MKNCDEITKNLLERRDRYVIEKKKKNITRLSSLISCFVVAVAVLGVGIWQGGWLDLNSLPASQEGNNNVTTNNITQDKTTNSTTEQPTLSHNSEVPADGGNNISSGGIKDGWFVPTLPSDREIKITGEAITDAEAQAYFSENQSSIIGILSSNGMSSNSIKISDKGYCHVNYNGEKGKSFEVRQNYRDYLVYNGNKLVAIITLYKEDGKIFNTPSFGAKWFDDYNTYLQAHKGQKLIYVYAGWQEIIIAPDNTYFNPLGHNISAYLEGVDKPYEMFYHETATYIP